MSDCQLAILQDVPARGRYVFFPLSSGHRDAVRQSLPRLAALADGVQVFVAFGHSFDAFEVLIRHMLGLDDGIVDALFGISRPVTGANFWCPPMRHGQLDLRQLDC